MVANTAPMAATARVGIGSVNGCQTWSTSQAISTALPAAPASTSGRPIIHHDRPRRRVAR